jgi:hypothetical protein
VRPLKNAPFCPIPASVSNFNPQNTKCIPVVKIFALLGLRQNRTFFKGLKIQRDHYINKIIWFHVVFSLYLSHKYDCICSRDVVPCVTILAEWLSH